MFAENPGVSPLLLEWLQLTTAWAFGGIFAGSLMDNLQALILLRNRRGSPLSLAYLLSWLGWLVNPGSAFFGIPPSFAWLLPYKLFDALAIMLGLIIFRVIPQSLLYWWAKCHPVDERDEIVLETLAPPWEELVPWPLVALVESTRYWWTRRKARLAEEAADAEGWGGC